MAQSFVPANWRDAYRKAIQVKDKSVLEMEQKVIDLLSEHEAGITSDVLVELIPLHSFPMQAALWKLTLEEVIEVSEDRVVTIKEVGW